MSNTETMREIEVALLALRNVCYQVALSLVKDPVLANQLTQETLLRVWSERETLDISFGVKTVLLARLRAMYLQKYRRVPSTLQPAASISF